MPPTILHRLINFIFKRKIKFLFPYHFKREKYKHKRIKQKLKERIIVINSNSINATQSQTNPSQIQKLFENNCCVNDCTNCKEYSAYNIEIVLLSYSKDNDVLEFEVLTLSAQTKQKTNNAPIQHTKTQNTKTNETGETSNQRVPLTPKHRNNMNEIKRSRKTTYEPKIIERAHTITLRIMTRLSPTNQNYQG